MFKIVCANNKIKFISTLLGILLISRSILIYLLPIEISIQAIPDDSFYYLKLACNFAKENIWTFDNKNPTSGFHILYAYLIFLFNKFFGCSNWRISYFVISLFSSILIALSCYLTCNLIRKKIGLKFAIYASVLFFSKDLILQSTIGMESALVIFTSSLIFYLLAKEFDFNSKNKTTYLGGNNKVKETIFFILGILSVFIRTDFIILNFIIYGNILFQSKLSIISLKNNLLNNDDNKRSNNFLFLFLGSICGYFLVTFHNYIFTKSFLQNSASIKLYWSSMIGHIQLPTIRLISDNLPIPIPLFEFKIRIYIIFSIIFLIFTKLIYELIKGKIKFLNKYLDKDNVLIESALLTIIGFLIFYSFNSAAIQKWYIAQFITPLTITSSYAVKYISSNFKLINRNCFISLILFINISFGIFHTFEYKPYLNQLEMLDAGRYLKNNLQNFKIASWNAGIIGFFSERDITNIDGLVNNNVAQYIKNDDLITYLIRNKVDYIIDYETMLTNKYYSLRGGYSDRKLVNCLINTDLKLGSNNTPLENTNIFLYKFINECKN